MSKNLILAQDISEFNSVRSKIKVDFVCLPLNLDLMVYCVLNRIPYINPANHLDNSIHEDGLIESEKFINKTKYNKFDLKVANARHKNLIRNYFNSIFFVKNTIEVINKKIGIRRIYVSGWKRNNIEIPRKNYILSEICKSLFKKKVVFVSPKKFDFDTNVNLYRLLNEKTLSKTKGGNLFTNFGYNFKRILFQCFLRRKEINYIAFDKISIIKKFIFKFLGIKYFIFSRLIYKKKISKKNLKINNKYSNKKISNLLNSRAWFFNLVIQDLLNRCSAIKTLILKLKPKVVFLNLVRGVDGYVASLSKQLKFNSICIPHGTVSKSFNRYDKIYKKIIAENVFSGDAKFFVLQTKIAKQSFDTHKINGKAIDLGNIIFSNVSRPNFWNKKFILYAVTMKDFINYQYYGVEMYYEFFENLKVLEKIARYKRVKIVVKPHPSINYLTKDLEKIFSGLTFSNSNIDTLLKKTIATISFSSTVIEDSICSKIPVILFDQWERYKHCESCSDVNRKNQLIYYVNSPENLFKAIKTIRSSNQFNYSKYLFSKSNVSKNIDKLIDRFSI